MPIIDMEYVLLNPTDNENKEKYTEKAIGQKLYHKKDWLMYRYLQLILVAPCPELDIVLVLNSKHKPIGVSICRTNYLDYYKNKFVMFYVLPRHRRKGVATKMADYWKTKYNNKVYGWDGVDGSEKFFDMVGIKHT